MWWFISFIVLIYVAYWLLKQPHKYWLKKGVNQGNPKFLFGHIWGTTTKTQSFADFFLAIYNATPGSRYSGIYQFLKPTLLIRDPELIKQITVKDFDHFTNHIPFVPDNCDPLWSSNLLVLNDKKWRDMRSILSPAFTGSKMRFMFELMAKTGQQFVDNFLQSDEKIVVLEMRNTLGRFANDVIASTAFGLECDSMSDKNNEFYRMGKEATYFGGFFNMLKFIGYSFFPGLLQYFKVPLFAKEVSTFFISTMKRNIHQREELGIVRPDVIHLLLQARQNCLKNDDGPEESTGFATVEESQTEDIKTPERKEITDIDITSQALIFILGGLDTTSSLMSFMAYELAVHQDIQDKLHHEISATWETCTPKPTYQAILSMKYLDMVVSETLRKWPSAVMTDRLCTKSYTIEPIHPNEKPLFLEKGSEVWLPTFAIQRDPKYFPDPDRFDPDRFSDDNKDNILPYTFLPFGTGPRNCIGSRFALLEAKLLFFYILKYFRIVPVKKTQIPLVINKDEFTLSAEKGIWVGFERRDR